MPVQALQTLETGNAEITSAYADDYETEIDDFDNYLLEAEIGQSAMRSGLGGAKDLMIDVNFAHRPA